MGKSVGSAGSITPELVNKLDRQLESWREKLLALDRRQRLLYFKHTAVGSLEVSDPAPETLLQLLVSGELTVRSADGDRRGGRALFVSNKTDETLSTSLRRIDTQSNQAYADKGVWTLNLGLWMLRWIDATPDKAVVESPILLVPVRVEKVGADQPYRLSRTEDDITVNPALKLKMMDDFNLDIPEVDPDDPSYETVISQLRKAVSGYLGWSVGPRVVMSNFTFHKEAMYRDLTDNKDKLAEHPIVQLLSLGPEAPTAGDYGFDEMSLEGLDDKRPPEQMFSILDADSTQRRCILTALQGKSFVMDGPPGTGKSQTIANMIAELISVDKTVLFVSEKAAALDVVRDRLDNANLKHFLFELHSHAATRKSVAQELGKSLRERPKARSTFGEQDLTRLRRTRLELTDFAYAMNEIDPRLERSVFGVVGRLTELGGSVDVSLAANSRWTRLSAAYLDDLRAHSERLGKLWYVVEAGDEYLWRDMTKTNLGAQDARRYARTAKKAADSARMVASRLETIDDDTGIVCGDTPRDIEYRARLLALLDTRNGTPAQWYASSNLDTFRDRLVSARVAVEEIDERIDDVEQVVGTRWREIDPGVRIRFQDNINDTIDSALTAVEIRVVVKTLDRMQEHLRALINGASELCTLVGIPAATLTIARARDVVDLAKLGGETNLPDPSWLNAAILDRVSESIDVMESVVAHAERREESLKDIFTQDALELDLSSLSVRFRDVHTGMRKWSRAARADKKLLKQATVSGRADKAVIARLEEAASWQLAMRELEAKEALHRGKLGSKYNGRSTEFDRARSALETARRAVSLAGTEINPGLLSAQIADGGHTDPRLLLVAEQTREELDAWARELGTLKSATSAALQHPSRLSDKLNEVAALQQKYAALLDVVHQVSSVAQGPLSIEQTLGVLNDLDRIAASEGELASRIELDAKLFGAALNRQTDFELLDRQLDHAVSMQALLQDVPSREQAEILAAARSTFQDLDEVIKNFERDRKYFTKLFDHDRKLELEHETSAGIAHFEVLLREFEDAAPNEVESWCETTKELRWFADIGYGDVLHALMSKPRKPYDVAGVLEYVALEAWLDSRSNSDQRLKRYRAADRSQEVRSFQSLDTQLVSNARARVIESCNRRAPVNTSSRAAQVLTREGEKKTRHKPVRKLLEETGSLVQQLKPCFMMSPLAVSQYLPPDMRFDVVIFDEASQVLPSDAVNCVYRGDQLIVAGDQKQLPPTDFFSAGSDDDDSADENEVDIFDSVLDLAKGAGGLTSLPLNWHYRSRHEDLISYSNYRFYGGKLHTFPGAVFEAPDLGVELLHVNGTYRRGTSRDNPTEAAKVAERVAWFREKYPESSIGVVTFSAAQEDCVLVEIDRQSKSRPSLVGITNEHDRLDGFFVKSLEKVQGDERDIIIFSLGYGPDENGKFTANFGPLNRSGGWRRLNVAITRARKRVEIVSSFSAGDMPDSTNESIRHLKNYVDFAERGQKALALALSDSEGDAESPFEEQVIAFVRGLGYEVVPQVGVAGYRIDMAVRHPTKPGLYVLGIECDGAAYHSGKTARDRDRLREQVLRNLGWSIHRIWGLSWWRDRSTQEQTLRQAIHDAIDAVDNPQSPSANTSDGTVCDTVGPLVQLERVDDSRSREWTTGYVELTVASEGTRDIRTPEGKRDAKYFFTEVMRTESPVHREILYERFKAAWGHQRLTVALKNEVDSALGQADRRGPDGDGFHRLGSANDGLVRVPEDGVGLRKFEHIAPDEIALAMCNVVKDSVAIDERNLMSQVAQVFGWQRISADIRIVLSRNIEALLAERLIRRDAAGDFALVYGDD